MCLVEVFHEHIRPGTLRERDLELEPPSDHRGENYFVDDSERRMVSAVLPARGAPPKIDLVAADRFRVAAQPVFACWLKRERLDEQKRDRESRRAHASAADAESSRRTMPAAKREIRFFDELAPLLGERNFEDRAAAITDRDSSDLPGPAEAYSNRRIAPLIASSPTGNNGGNGNVSVYEGSGEFALALQARTDMTWLAGELGKQVGNVEGETSEAYEDRRSHHIHTSFKNLTDVVLELRLTRNRWPNAETVTLLAVARSFFDCSVQLGVLEGKVEELGWLRQARAKRNQKRKPTR